MTLIGERIKKRREQLELSRQDLADVLHTTPKQVWRYEKGENDPTGVMVASIAKALDVSTDWLLGLTDVIKTFYDESDLDEKERHLLELYRGKSPESQKKLISIAEVV